MRSAACLVACHGFSGLGVDVRIRISDTEMTPESLDSIERIAAFVARKRPADAPAT